MQLSVSLAVGVLHWQMTEEKIDMEVNAAFLVAVFNKAREHPVYQQHYLNRRIVIVFDNAPAHSRTESRVSMMLGGPEEPGTAVKSYLLSRGLILLRLSPYSPMLNPCESVFSTLKAELKHRVLEKRNDINNYTVCGSMTSF